MLISLEKKRPKSLTLLITIEDELWLPITTARWSLIFPNRINQNYSKATFIWQKENKLCIIKTTAHKLLFCICSSLRGQLWWKWSIWVQVYQRRRNMKKKRAELSLLEECQKSSMAYTLMWGKDCIFPTVNVESLILSQGQSPTNAHFIISRIVRVDYHTSFP